MSGFDSSRIQNLLGVLDAKLAAAGARADIYLVGGAAIALSFDDTRATRDLDAVFVPTEEVRQAAAAVAADEDLLVDWLNDAAKGFVPPGVDQAQRVVYESEHLRVCTASAEHLLAMKVAASRVERDRSDLELLVRQLGLTSSDQALDLARACLGPGYPIPPRAMYLLGEIFENENRRQSRPAPTSVTPLPIQTQGPSGVKHG